MPSDWKKFSPTNQWSTRERLDSPICLKIIGLDKSCNFDECSSNNYIDLLTHCLIWNLRSGSGRDAPTVAPWPSLLLAFSPKHSDVRIRYVSEFYELCDFNDGRPAALKHREKSHGMALRCLQRLRSRLLHDSRSLSATQSGLFIRRTGFFPIPASRMPAKGPRRGCYK